MHNNIMRTGVLSNTEYPEYPEYRVGYIKKIYLIVSFLGLLSTEPAVNNNQGRQSILFSQPSH